MSMLVIQLPARSRTGGAVPEGAAEYGHVLSADGLAASAHGRSTTAQLPRADTVVAVLPATEIGWHRITLPRAPASRLRAALAGVLEEQLLDDDEQVQLALAPQARAGQPTWVAAVHRPWLAAQLATLEQAGLAVERVVPALWPDANAHGHFFPAPEHAAGSGTDAAEPWLALADETGVCTLRLGGGLARQLHSRWKERSASFTAEPAVAAAAERWLGAPVQVHSEADALLAAARSPWNLRQFSLVSHHRGLRALRDGAKKLMSPAWRPVRWGLAALLLAQVLGLNLWAWQQQRTLAARQQAMNALLRSSHPQVRAVLDAPTQMQRETELLRAAAGRAGDADLEPLVALAAQAWPPGQAPVQGLRFEAGKLTLMAPGWAPPQIEQFRSRVAAAGVSVDSAEGRLVLSRGAPAVQRGTGAVPGGTPGGTPAAGKGA
ncbi:type II secretion system protein GspL [Aquabacterium sp.]|uniref:type II secretion system protein GspL n=1 Tax=Aquabacterium sp. TaxID=1872578 RepID=UPI002BECDB62|nr:type II secretion system protein GspL [Aquabacterium sp.]HSW07119.1 type II secretion system protein GspL [Aquabacterium sp.]